MSAAEAVAADKASDASAEARHTHPRLYGTAADFQRLSGLRTSGVHQRIWRNLEQSAQWCLTQTPRKAWIAPIEPDPIYENLYDRFYAIMADLAITEHLAFAYALSGEPRYGDAARDWVMASSRAWRREADDAPNGAKAYAVCRLLKGVAVGYDLAYDRFSAAERDEVRGLLLAIGQKYFDGYFSTPTIAGPTFHTHHAVVEWGSFGVAALALLGETHQADIWLAATTAKFEQHLLPRGLAADGAQVEGATFWASTMHYRLFYMDALRRVTGQDLFTPFKKVMQADLALASIATGRNGGYDQDQASIVLEPSYGQLDYYAPVLLALAREYRNHTQQYLALWDETLGSLQRTRYVTPHGEPLLFSLGGYAYVWYDPSVPARADSKKLSFHFPSVDEAYLRASWNKDDLLVGVRKGELVMHAGGLPLVIEPMAGRDGPALGVQSLTDEHGIAHLRYADAASNRRLEITLDRPQRKLTIRRRHLGEWTWWSHALPAERDRQLSWTNGATLALRAGTLGPILPDGYGPSLATGFLKLELADPAPRKFAQVTCRPDADDLLEVEFRWPETGQSAQPAKQLPLAD